MPSFTQIFVVDHKAICCLCFDVLIHSHQVLVRVMKVNEYTQILEGLVVNEIVVVPIEGCCEQSSVSECAQHPSIVFQHFHVTSY